MSSPLPAPMPFDARALTEPVDPREAALTRRQLKEAAPGRSGVGATAVILGIGIALAVVNLLFSLLGVALALLGPYGRIAPGALIPAVFPLLVAAGIIVGVVLWRRRTRDRQHRLVRFAASNGMTYLPRIDAPALPGMIFGIGRDRRADDAVRGTHPRFVEFANYRYTTGGGKNRTTHRWGYVAIRLDAPLPHIVLDALGNNSVFGSNLPVGFDRSQRLSLEGDFDQSFALYCPAGYEADALYLFTPDIMARFLDHAGELDVEIVDDWLLLYARRDLSTTDPATWAWLFSVVAALLDKLAQWGRWRDARLAGSPAPHGAQEHGLPFTDPGSAPPPPGVAAPGRRLRRRFSWFVLVVALAIGAGFVVAYIGTVIASFSP